MAGNIMGLVVGYALFGSLAFVVFCGCVVIVRAAFRPRGK